MSLGISWVISDERCGYCYGNEIVACGLIHLECCVLSHTMLITCWLNKSLASWTWVLVKSWFWCGCVCWYLRGELRSPIALSEHIARRMRKNVFGYPRTHRFWSRQMRKGKLFLDAHRLAVSGADKCGTILSIKNLYLCMYLSFGSYLKGHSIFTTSFEFLNVCLT